jgi:hypothetical protein
MLVSCVRGDVSDAVLAQFNLIEKKELAPLSELNEGESLSCPIHFLYMY